MQFEETWLNLLYALDHERAYGLGLPKTQTRRLVNGETLLTEDYGYDAPTVVTTTVYSFRAIDWMGQAATFNGHRDRIKWQVGRTYAVQPGRGRRAIWIGPGSKPPWERVMAGTESLSDKQLRAGGARQLRVRIRWIRAERLSDITADDAWTEGLNPDTALPCPYCTRPDGTIVKHICFRCGATGYDSRATYFQLWDSIHTKRGTRSEDDPDVWALGIQPMLL